MKALYFTLAGTTRRRWANRSMYGNGSTPGILFKTIRTNAVEIQWHGPRYTSYHESIRTFGELYEKVTRDVPAKHELYRIGKNKYGYPYGG